jgi:hypothetical protein
MDINPAGIQEPRGFGDNFTQGFPITEKENNEFEVPYYESDNENECDDTASDCPYETESDYASSDELVATRRVVVRLKGNKPAYKTLLYVEDDFLPE